MEVFENLTNEERDTIFNAPVLIAILIAGADGTLDRAEIREAKSIKKLKKRKASESIIKCFQEAGQDIEDKVKVGILRLPSNYNERCNLIEEKLGELNDIFPKLEKPFVIEFYESLKDYARRIAQASGGIFGFKAIGNEEAQLIDLKIISDPNCMSVN